MDRFIWDMYTQHRRSQTYDYQFNQCFSFQLKEIYTPQYIQYIFEMNKHIYACITFKVKIIYIYQCAVFIEMQFYFIELQSHQSKQL